MKSLYQSPWFTFRFGEDRVIDRFHLEGVLAAQRISIFRLDEPSNQRGELIRLATADASGWVELAEPIVVRAGDCFIAVPTVD
jgi:hypothetical protein